MNRHRRLVRGVVVASALTLVITAAAPPPSRAGAGAGPPRATITAATVAAEAPPFTRVSGADRYATAVAISHAAYPSAGSAGTVVVASGQNFPDGLAAGPVAVRLDGPLLLTTRSSLPPAVRDEIIRLDPDRIIIAGGTAVVGSAVESALRSIQPNTERIGGANRYIVSEALVRAAFPTADRVYIATGQNYPDALSVGPLAAKDGAPLLLVRGYQTSVPAEVRRLLDDLGTTKVTLIGGTGVVSSGFEQSLRSTGRTVDRIGGADRYAVSLGIAQRYGSTGGALVTTGRHYPDGLTAISLAHRLGDPLVLTLPYCAPTSIADHLVSHAGSGTVAIGGRGAVTDLAMKLEPCRSTTSASSLWVLVNKKNALRPVGYVPSGLRAPGIRRFNGALLRSDAASALEQLVAAARNEGVGEIALSSGYRSYSTQAALYAGYVRTRGQAWADSQSARAGHSEHQTGLAADLVACSSSGCGSIYSISTTPQGRWLFSNAHRFGFILRYPGGKTHITGYTSEPWHWRYVGTTLANEYRASGHSTLEGYLGYPAAPGY